MRLDPVHLEAPHPPLAHGARSLARILRDVTYARKVEHTVERFSMILKHTYCEVDKEGRGSGSQG